MSHRTTTDNGVHITFHQNFANVRGTRVTSGEEYRVARLQNNQANSTFDGGVPTEFAFFTRAVVISQGSEPNQLGSFYTHTVINAQGEVTVQKVEFSFDCTG